MTENEAIKFLLQHHMHRMNEFLNENKAEEIAQADMAQRFARFLYSKDATVSAVKVGAGMIAQAFNSEQVADEESMVMAHLKLFKEQGVCLMWMAELFINPAMPMPDLLREQTVKALRFHADRLESGEIDERLKGIFKNRVGQT